MTPNDSQIELLIRRQAARPRRTSTVGEHLDADALNALAEGALPTASRSLYISHLADCDECRELVSELSLHAGSAAAIQKAEARAEPATSWWKSLAGFIALPTVRYAAVAVALAAVVGITFLAWRRSNPSHPELVAQNQPAANAASTVASGAESPSAGAASSAPAERSSIAKVLPQPTIIPSSREKVGESADAPPPSPKAQSENAITESEPAVVANKPAATARAETSPSFAPQPADTNESRPREQQNVGGIIHGGPRRSESSEKYKVLDRSRPADVAKEEDRVRGVTVVDEDKKDKNIPKQSAQNGRLAASAGTADNLRMEARKENTSTISTTIVSTRSVGGRKFQRSGNIWVDVKFKSTMSIRNIARGSEEFEALDSKLKSIAQQLGGEVVIVWKGKAYRIR